MMSDNLPAIPAERGVRRRRPATAATTEHGELAVYHEPEAEGGSGIAEGHHFVHPSEEFPQWDTIRESIFEEFVKRSSQHNSSPDQERQPAPYFEMVNDMVTRHPEWAVQPVDLPHLVELLRVYHFGYGPLEDYMHIDGLEDLYFNDHHHGFYIVRGQKHRIQDGLFHDERELTTFVQHVARENGLEINLDKPNLDATLKDGARLNATLPPLAVGGPDFVIRQHSEIGFTIEQYISTGMMTQELADDIERWIKDDKLNIVVSGGTSSGKTSLLNTVGNAFLPKDTRLLIIENRKELQIEVEDMKYYQTREDATRESEDDISVQDLIRWCLRKRPDRIIVGEMRGYEAYAALIAWNSGHDGSLCTIHADNAPGALDKLEQLATEKGVLSERAIRKLIGRSVDIVIQVQRSEGESARQVTEVVEVFNPRKYNRRDRAVAARYEELLGDPNEGLYEAAEGGDLMILPLYDRDDDGKLVKINDLLPIHGKTKKTRN